MNLDRETRGDRDLQARKNGVLPTFDLSLSSIAVIEGRRYFVKERLGDQWVFIDVQNERPRLLCDAEIAALCCDGSFYLDCKTGPKQPVSKPISPLQTSPKAHADNIRKHAYVAACLGLGEYFRRSRAILEPIIAEVAETRGEKRPGFSTVLTWIDEYRAYGDAYGTAAYSDRHDQKGRTGSRLAPWQDRAIQVGLDTYLSGSRITMAMAYATACDHIREFDEQEGNTLDKSTLPSKLVDRDRRLVPPSLRTFERRCRQIDRYTLEYHKRGPRFAAIHGRTYATTELPSRPYEQVEVDHGRLDILIVDENGIIFGRPDVIVFRDRATAMILGFSVGFEEPSYASFLEGLRHCIYPKDLGRFPSVQNPWPCYGRPENLFVDNALHFIGHNIEEAAHELGFNIVKLKPRSPWLKGALERFFGSLNVGLIHVLPGTTLQNVLERGEHEELGDATLTLQELEALITRWICDDYHVRPTKGLGVIRGLGDIPLRIWNDLAKKCPASIPPNPDLFVALAGDTSERTIQKDGVVWDYLKYEGPELISVLSHPDHGVRREGRNSSRYKVLRDPYRLAEIKLINHHSGEVITLPATAAHRDYASRVTLHQHRVIVARAKEQVRGELKFDDLQRTRAQLAELARKLLGNRPKNTQRRLARYIQRETSARFASRIDVSQTDSDARDFLDLEPRMADAAPPALPEATVGIGTIDPTPRPAAPASPLADTYADMSDLEEFSKRKRWEVSDGRHD